MSLRVFEEDGCRSLLLYCLTLFEGNGISSLSCMVYPTLLTISNFKLCKLVVKNSPCINLSSNYILWCAPTIEFVSFEMIQIDLIIVVENSRCIFSMFDFGLLCYTFVLSYLHLFFFYKTLKTHLFG